MKAFLVVAAFAVACWLSCPGQLFAKGAGHGSGGHGSSGHASGHASGGHASSGRSSGGHTSGSHTGATSQGHAAPRGGSTQGGHPGDRPVAVPRPSLTTPFAASLPYLPSRVI